MVIGQQVLLKITVDFRGRERRWTSQKGWVIPRLSKPGRPTLDFFQSPSACHWWFWSSSVLFPCEWPVHVAFSVHSSSVLPGATVPSPLTPNTVGLVVLRPDLKMVYVYSHQISALKKKLLYSIEITNKKPHIARLVPTFPNITHSWDAYSLSAKKYSI